MPAVTQVILFDDQAWPERVLAQEVVRLTLRWQAIEGAEHGQHDAELYLTAEGRKQLEEHLDRYFALGHRPGSAGLAAAGEEPKNWIGGSRQGSVDRCREIRKFADARGLRSKKDPSRAAYETPTGSWSYPKWLIELYEQWAAEGRPPREMEEAS